MHSFAGGPVKIQMRAAALASIFATAVATAKPALAQDSGDGFLFHQPTGSWSLHGGFAMPSARSDIFTFTTSQLTVNRGDFAAMEIGADLAFTVSPRLDIVLDLSYSGASKGSAFRNFVDNNQQPIQQT